MNLTTLRNEAAICELCGLYKGRINPVFDKGNPNAKVVVCGMCPADEENATGVPFVGRAGQLLNILLEASGFSLEDVYITNLVKCYLTAGKKLEEDWIYSCLPYMLVQISIIKPVVIITLGADASNALLTRPFGSTIGEIRGQVFKYAENMFIVPTYHPSYLLRRGGLQSKIFHSVVENIKVAKNLELQYGQ
jgi:uracil-DNA glycosylase